MEINYLPYILTFVFLFLSVFVFKGYKYQVKAKYKLNSTVKLSLVIAAKNEEKSINILINFLEKLSYPNENFEIIIV